MHFCRGTKANFSFTRKKTLTLRWPCFLKTWRYNNRRVGKSARHFGHEFFLTYTGCVKKIANQRIHRWNMSMHFQPHKWHALTTILQSLTFYHITDVFSSAETVTPSKLSQGFILPIRGKVLGELLAPYIATTSERWSVTCYQYMLIHALQTEESWSP